MLADALGPCSAMRYRWQLWRERRVPPGTPLTVTSRESRHPLVCRARTSDLAVFRQIFIDREYAPLGVLRTDGVILDCGANIGCSSAWFLSRYPGMRVLAVEPDAENAALLARNLAPWGDAAMVVHGAVWSHVTRVAIVDAPYRDGQPWTRQVRECRRDEPGGMPAYDIPELLTRARADRIALLKMDIEGAEAVVFGAPDLAWLDRVDAMAIELHADAMFGDGTRVFHQAMAGRGFRLEQSGELTLARRS